MQKDTNRQRAKRRRRHEKHVDSSKPVHSQTLISALSPLNFVDQAQIEQLHEASLHILSQTGLIFNSQTALTYFQQAGARVEENRVFLDSDLIDHCLHTAPAEYTHQASPHTRCHQW